MTLFDTNHRQPFIIAGPCSAETESQILATATSVATDDRVNMFRAGIWKPRTRPGSFEGVGAQALTWLQDAKSETGLPLCVEVANAEHVELCTEAGIDLLWIGARTTVNPFAVQDIADALRGVDIPVAIKNPINPDIGLWIGACERIQHAGISRIAAIHRGFSYASGDKDFRNRPQWQIPIEFMQRLPEIPMICDPSHICGKRETIASVCQKALDINMRGLMIEVHPDPDNAWSDAQQQVSPSQLRNILDGLTVRHYDRLSANNNPTLQRLRRQIDVIDDEIIDLLIQRMNVVEHIGDHKYDTNQTILQPERWKDVKTKYTSTAASSSLSKNFLLAIVQAIHDESIDRQELSFVKHNEKREVN